MSCQWHSVDALVCVCYRKLFRGSACFLLCSRTESISRPHTLFSWRNSACSKTHRYKRHSWHTCARWTQQSHMGIAVIVTLHCHSECKTDSSYYLSLFLPVGVRNTGSDRSVRAEGQRAEEPGGHAPDQGLCTVGDNRKNKTKSSVLERCLAISNSQNIFICALA